MKTLHKYQEEGAGFLTDGGQLLADQPGLGKTLQAIEAMKRLGARRVLIVCPAVALGVWRDELADCWPECASFYLRDAELGTFVGWLDEPWAMITGYEYLLVNDHAKTVVNVAATDRKFDVLILDEAHALKNPSAKRTQLIYGPGCAGGGVASMAKHVMLLTVRDPKPSRRNLASFTRARARAYRRADLRWLHPSLLHDQAPTIKTKSGATRQIDNRLATFLAQLLDYLPALGETITHQYFSHAAPARHLAISQPVPAS